MQDAISSSGRLEECRQQECQQGVPGAATAAGTQGCSRMGPLGTWSAHAWLLELAPDRWQPPPQQQWQREPLSSVLGDATRPHRAPVSPVAAASESSINAVLAQDCPRVSAGPGMMGPRAGCSFCTHCVRLPLTSHKELTVNRRASCCSCGG